MKTNNLSFADFDKVMFQINKNAKISRCTNPKAIWYEKGTLEEEAAREGFSSVEDYWKSEKNAFLAGR